MSNVSLIVPYYHSAADLKIFLERLKDFSGEIIVVSNDEIGSTPPPLHHPQARLIELKQNTGFSHACNVGAAHATSDWLLFANPDTHLTSDSIRDLVARATKENLIAASPLLVDESGRVATNYHQNFLSFAAVVCYYLPVIGKYLHQPIFTKRSLSGAALLISSTVLWQLGGWKEILWLWWEDVDLNRRIDHAGFNWKVISEVQVVHPGGATFTQSDSWKLQTYFHSLRLYVLTNFGARAEKVVYLLTKRFSKVRAFPPDKHLKASKILDLSVDNDIEERLSSNEVNQEDELIVMTSQPISKELRKIYPLVIFCDAYGEYRSRFEAGI